MHVHFNCTNYESQSMFKLSKDITTLNPSKEFFSQPLREKL